MAISDDEPRFVRPGQPVLAAQMDLTPLGITELELYIADLQLEIDRARAVIDAKRGHLSGAEALFKR